MLCSVHQSELKPYSLISYSGRSQKFSKFEFFAPICSFSLGSTFPQMNLAEIPYEIDIFSINSHVQELI